MDSCLFSVLSLGVQRVGMLVGGKDKNFVANISYIYDCFSLSLTQNLDIESSTMASVNRFREKGLQQWVSFSLILAHTSSKY